MAEMVQRLIVNGSALRPGGLFWAEEFGVVTGPLTCRTLRANRAINYGAVTDTVGGEWSQSVVFTDERKARQSALTWLRREVAHLSGACQRRRRQAEEMERLLAALEGVPA